MKEIAAHMDHFVSTSIVGSVRADHLDGRAQAVPGPFPDIYCISWCNGHLSTRAPHETRFCPNLTPFACATQMYDMLY